ncbi:MAG: autorepressor SdpR family transcription factor [Roseburia sp.]|nr:autorepressor SdpR family transcription factor [Roseburia sp.]
MSVQATLRAVADPTRREILELLKKRGLPAGEIAAKFPVSGAAVSKHLAVLKDAGLVRDRREGKYIIYELNASVLEEVLLWLNGLRGGAT